MLPAATVLNSLPPPHSSRAVEIEEHPAARPPRVLQNKMSVEQNGFYFRQKRIIPIDVRPPRLYHPNFRVGEVVNHLQQKIFCRSKVGIENGNILTLRCEHPILQRPGLVAFAIRAVNIRNRVAQRRVTFHQIARYFYCCIRGIIE